MTLQIAGRLDKDADEFIALIVDGAARMQRMICWHIHGSVHAASHLNPGILQIYSTRQGTIRFK